MEQIHMECYYDVHLFDHLYEFQDMAYPKRGGGETIMNVEEKVRMITWIRRNKFKPDEWIPYSIEVKKIVNYISRFKNG